jgi:membrane fusion protein, copper/silver efflux system
MSTHIRSTRQARMPWFAVALLTVSVAAAGFWGGRGTASPSNAVDTAMADPQGGDDQHAVDDMAGAEDAVVHLTPEMMTSLGVATVAAELGSMQKVIRTNGNVAYDETRLTTIAPKYAGFVERLHVNFTGQPVRRGQALLEIYSPELVAAQEELLTALRMEQQLRAGGAASSVIDRTAGLVAAARRRLLLWDVSAAQVEQIERSGEVRRTLTMHAPSGGFVTEMMVQAGQAVEMGMPLYRLADLGRVWIEADVYEQDLRAVRPGESVGVDIAAYPGETFHGRVSYIHPDVRPDTRTARIRIDLANPGARLKPGMYATVLIDAPAAERAVLVPRDAVMHAGTHAMVFVQEREGVFRAREVQVGGDVGGRTQILAGLLVGERVVNRANFLLDSESRLLGSMGDMPGHQH